jgi:hypothetical protein
MTGGTTGEIEKVLEKAIRSGEDALKYHEQS